MTDKMIAQFDYGEIKLLDSKLEKHFDKILRYYMSISVDDMLFELRKKCNIQNKEGAKSLHNCKNIHLQLRQKNI